MILATMLVAVTGYVIEARGVVALHRQNATQSSPASAGEEVHTGDTIRLSANAKARILCPDLMTTWEPAPQNTSGVFERCPATSERIRSRQGQQALGLRSVDQAPWVLMPSNTLITTTNPIIRWEPIAGAVRYRVSVLRVMNPPHVVWGPALVDGTSVRYTGKQPLLVGIEYLVRVEGERGVMAEGKPFVLSSAGIGLKIDERKRHFEQTIPEQTPREIATAIYLLNENLRADALFLLDRLTGTEKSAALNLLEARSLGEAGDVRGQQEALKRTLAEAEWARDWYCEAEALQELSKVSKAEEAARLSKRAAGLLQKLGLR